MKHYTTAYKLTKDNEVKLFNSEKEACAFLGVQKCTVASSFRHGRTCMGWQVERLGLTTHGESRTRLHKVWEAMLTRCEDPGHIHYDNYGGRGITVCEAWHDYKVFSDWAKQNGYQDTLSIDRLDNDKGYEPSNCRWSTHKEQNNNRRTNHLLTWNGETKNLTEWSEITGIKLTTIKERLNLGWSVEATLSTPIRRRTKGYRPSVANQVN